MYITDLGIAYVDFAVFGIVEDVFAVFEVVEKFDAREDADNITKTNRDSFVWWAIMCLLSLVFDRNFFEH